MFPHDFRAKYSSRYAASIHTSSFTDISIVLLHGCRDERAGSYREPVSVQCASVCVAEVNAAINQAWLSAWGQCWVSCAATRSKPPTHTRRAGMPFIVEYVVRMNCGDPIFGLNVEYHTGCQAVAHTLLCSGLHRIGRLEMPSGALIRAPAQRHRPAEEA